MKTRTPPTLVFAWGNPSRGDDALGPRFLERLQQRAAQLSKQQPAWQDVEFLGDFQLQVEHVLDLRERRRVLFVDASLTAPAPFSVSRIAAARDDSFTSHALTPQALLHAWNQIESTTAPPAWLLAIRGESFELGAELGDPAQHHLAAAVDWAERWITSE